MRIRWTEAATHDLTTICDYSSDHLSSSLARETALRIYGAIDTLAAFPHSGRFGRKPGTRELVFTGLPFLEIYRVREKEIEIVRILHGAQRWP
jgi:plasmid stabilization system protein ParE